MVKSKKGEGSKFSIVIPFERSDFAAAQEEYETSPAALVAARESSLPKLDLNPSSVILSSHDIQQELTKQAGRDNSDTKEIMAPKSLSSKSIASKFKALCVDDVPSNRKLLSLILSKRGISALTAEDGLECLDIVKERGIDHFDVIFMDNTMPKMNGITCTRMLRTMNFRHYIIALTGNSLDDELEEFSNAGADIVLTKPFKLPLLDTLIDFFDQQGFNSAFISGQSVFIDDEKFILCPKKKVAGQKCR